MSDAMSKLRRRRAKVEAVLDDHGLLYTLSAARYQLRTAVSRAIVEFAHGNVLEAGSGRSPYRASLPNPVSSVTALDIDPETKPDILGDVQDMSDVADAMYDTVLSTQVLEHVPNPWKAMSEFARVLRPGGVLILSAPHLSMIHDAPHDYYRFTVYGFQNLCNSSGLEVVEVRSVGGPLSLVGHVFSVGLLSTAAAVPGLFWPVWALNYLLLVRGVGIVDELTRADRILPRDYVLVARRR